MMGRGQLGGREQGVEGRGYIRTVRAELVNRWGKARPSSPSPGKRDSIDPPGSAPVYTSERFVLQCQAKGSCQVQGNLASSQPDVQGQSGSARSS